MPVRFVRDLLPGFVRTWLRSVVRPSGSGGKQSAPGASMARATAVAPPPEDGTIDVEAFLRFSVVDLFYAPSDLDRAMDLLAVCELAPSPTVDRPA